MHVVAYSPQPKMPPARASFILRRAYEIYHRLRDEAYKKMDEKIRNRVWPQDLELAAKYDLECADECAATMGRLYRRMERIKLHVMMRCSHTTIAPMELLMYKRAFCKACGAQLV